MREGGQDIVISRDSLGLQNAFTAPTDDVERKICRAFGSVLRVDPIGLDDEFYDLGGDSLAGERLSLEIECAVGRPFALSQLFEFSTPRKISELLGPRGLQKPRSSSEEILFIVHGRGGYTALLPEFRAALGSGRRVHTFELPGIRGDGDRIRRISDLAAIYVREIELLQPSGPVRLGAFCVGSLIALEMAALLEQRGRPLDRVVLLDPRLPGPVNRRYRAERALRASGGGALAALRYFLRTGRLPHSRSPDPVLAGLRFRWASRVELKGIRRDRERGVGFAKRNEGLGLLDKPRAALVASYRFAWPRPFSGQAFILASRERVHTFHDPDTAWEWLTPNRIVEVVAERHGEIGNTSAPVVARRMDELLA